MKLEQTISCYPWYLNKLIVLLLRFSIGLWIVGDESGWLCTIGTNMKLEQTIQCDSEVLDGHDIFGSFQNANVVSMLIFCFKRFVYSITTILNILTTYHN